MFKTRQFWECFLKLFSTYFCTENTVRNIAKIDQIKKFGFSKKAAVVSNFCLIGKIHHNFLVPRMIELVCKTFIPIQTLDLHKVICPIYLTSVQVILVVDTVVTYYCIYYEYYLNRR